MFAIQVPTLIREVAWAMIWQFINESFMNSGEKIDSNPAASALLAKSCNSVKRQS